MTMPLGTASPCLLLPFTTAPPASHSAPSPRARRSCTISRLEGGRGQLGGSECDFCLFFRSWVLLFVSFGSISAFFNPILGICTPFALIVLSGRREMGGRGKPMHSHSLPRYLGALSSANIIFPFPLQRPHLNAAHRRPLRPLRRPSSG
jgi:hypothetical protein